MSNYMQRVEELIEAQEKAFRCPLPIDSKDADPALSKENVDYHYDILHKGYVDKAKKGDKSDFVLGGVQLHNLFFEQLQPYNEHERPFDASHHIIHDNFPGFAGFTRLFREKALTLEGSGWCYLSITGEIKLIKNHKPTTDVAVIVDMWEHAYYGDYGPDKKAYLDEIWNLIDWRIVNARLG